MCNETVCSKRFLLSLFSFSFNWINRNLSDSVVLKTKSWTLKIISEWQFPQILNHLSFHHFQWWELLEELNKLIHTLVSHVRQSLWKCRYLVGKIAWTLKCVYLFFDGSLYSNEMFASWFSFENVFHSLSLRSWESTPERTSDLFRDGLKT